MKNNKKQDKTKKINQSTNPEVTEMSDDTLGDVAGGGWRKFMYGRDDDTLASWWKRDKHNILR